jgi:hypothetical protein
MHHLAVDLLCGDLMSAFLQLKQLRRRTAGFTLT